MLKVIFIMIVLAMNILLFQNFTTVSDDERETWGTEIEEADNNAYNDFKSALDQSKQQLKETKESWSKEFEELNSEEDSQEVGARDLGKRESAL